MTENPNNFLDRARRFFQSGRPKAGSSNYSSVTHSIEISYTRLGPVLALSGRMEVGKGVVMVEEIAGQLIHRRRTGINHFVWYAFLPPGAPVANLRTIELTAPDKFMVSSQHPHDYEILFNDRDRYAEMKASLNRVRDAWNARTAELPEAERKNPKKSFNEFLKDDSIREEAVKIRTSNYWHAGTYEFDVIIHCGDKKNYQVSKVFSLSPDDQTFLDNNTEAILADICNVPGEAYRFVKPDLMNK